MIVQFLTLGKGALHLNVELNTGILLTFPSVLFFDSYNSCNFCVTMNKNLCSKRAKNSQESEWSSWYNTTIYFFMPLPGLYHNESSMFQLYFDFMEIITKINSLL